jgi:cytochrome P450
LRWEAPLTSIQRTAMRDAEIGGVAIPAGTIVMVLNGAANRDPRHFENPAEFRADRANAHDHIAFGLGIHSCPGAPLARAEARVAIARLLDRMADVRISDTAHGAPGSRRYEYVPTYILRGLQKLHLEFRPIA